MNQMQQMKDPAAGVPRELLPHLHLISKQRYPVNNNPSLETIVAYLLEAPKIVRENQPVQWQYLECPADGTLFLTWQPPDLGVNFATDGFVWADQEAPFTSDVRGYTLQMFMHKSGFRPQEAMACHSRRRYRLLSSQQMPGAMADPSLWLIHYSKAAPRDQIATASIPVAPPVHAQLQQRRMIMSAGALARKEFMLPDRNNWPFINLPGGINRQGPAGQGVPNVHRRAPSLTGHEPTIEEEEDVSRGDALDFMTPRDISRMRYEQHHEWMEEVLESPYRTMQIVPPALGLGRKGELEVLTKDFFDAPTGVVQEPLADGDIPRIGRLDPGKAEEFTRQANQKLADMQRELEKMKQAHQRRMEKLRKATALTSAEKRLRSAPSGFGQKKSAVSGSGSVKTDESDPVDEIVKEVEESMGRKIEQVKSVTRVAKGGYQEPQPNTLPISDQTHNTTVPTKQNSIPTASNNVSHSSTSQVKQEPPPPPPPSASMTDADPMKKAVQTPNPQPAIKPSSDNGQGPDLSTTENLPTKNGAADVDMVELDEPSQADDGLGDAGDWVMVDDTNAPDNMDTPSLDHLVKSMDNSDQDQDLEQGEDSTPLNTGVTPVANDNSTPQAAEQSKQQQHQQPFPQVPDNQPTGDTPLDTGDFDFDDVNTAGDALADYGAEDDLNLDNMDDSAFGDAFHGPDDNDHL